MIEIFTPCRPEPQGSGRAMMIGGKARFIATSSNKQGKRMRSYRQEVADHTQRRMSECSYAPFPKHVPVFIDATFFFLRPKSVPLSRLYPVVKPDVDKLLRATLDALKGVLYHDDAQVVEAIPRKLYGDIEGVRIFAREMGGK